MLVAAALLLMGACSSEESDPVTSTGSTTGAGGMQGECTESSQCPGQDDACSSRTCNDAQCGVQHAVAGTVCPAGSCDGAGICVPALAPNGEVCSSANACASGFCVDGVCCAEACAGACLACDLAAALGTCSPVEAGTDPASECFPGVCDGAGACQGASTWTKDYNGGGLDTISDPVRMVVDSSDAVIAVGNYTGQIDFGGGLLLGGSQELFVAKISSSGDTLWAKSLKGTPGSVTVDGSDNVYVTGRAYGTVDFGGGPQTTTGSDDVFVVAFDAQGGYQWSQLFDTSGASSKGVAVDSGGNVVLVGEFDGAVDFGGGALNADSAASDTFIAKWHPKNGHVYSKRFGDSYPAVPTDVVIDKSDRFTIAGEFFGSIDFGGGAHTSSIVDGGFYAAQFNSNGSLGWSVGAPSSYYVSPRAMAIDNAGNIAVSGRLRGGINFGGGEISGQNVAFIVKLSASGAHGVSMTFGPGSGSATGVAFAPSGDMLVAGFFKTSWDAPPFVSGGGEEVFLLSISPSGSIGWSESFGGGGDQSANALAVDSKGNAILFGECETELDFGGDSIKADGVDSYAAKLSL